jgi:hypothetical protein
MAGKPSYEELEQRVQELEEEAFKRKVAEEALRANQIEISAILDNAPLMMVLVDQDRRVRKASDALMRFTARKEEEIIGLREGEAFRCIYHLDDPKGCGFGPVCEACTLRRVILDTFKTGDSYRKVKATLSFKKDEIEKRILLVSTALLNIPEKKVLVCIEDITEREQAEKEREKLITELQDALAKVKTLSGLLPICSSCKKIRDDNGYWSQIESYIHDHSDAKFSHSICPKCAKKLYPEIYGRHSKDDRPRFPRSGRTAERSMNKDQWRGANRRIGKDRRSGIERRSA